MARSELDCAVIVDTNVLLDMGDPSQFNWGERPVTVYILRAVVDELRGLTRDESSPATADAANHLLQVLDGLERRAPDGGFAMAHGSRLVFLGPPARIEPPLDPTSVDHQQIEWAQELLQAGVHRFCILVTRDREMADIAQAVVPNLFVSTPGSRGLDRRIQQQIDRLTRWTREDRPTKAPPTRRQPATRRTAAPARPMEPVVQQLYGRIRSVRHRAVLAIAPRAMRVALTAHIVQAVAQSRSRIVLVFASSAPEADAWAADLRCLADLPAGSVVLYGKEPLGRIGPVRVVIYRHDQIERHVERHAARFRRAGRRATAVVDGCDLVAPAGIVQILLHCNQFIGYRHLPPDHLLGIGSRTLGAFRSPVVASYTFADAERDGLLASFDPRPFQVTLQEDEQAEYDRVTNEMIELHRAMGQLYPELREDQELWQRLGPVLDREVEPAGAKLYLLREQQEWLAQCARAKDGAVAEIFAAEDRAARCLIYGYDTVRSRVLGQKLAGLGFRVQVLDRPMHATAWTEAWKQFIQGKLDCLILHEVPPAATEAHIKHLIFPSPLVPFPLLAAMLDWTLSHASRATTVTVNMLYTAGSPEKKAMMALTDSCCGVPYGR